MVSGFFMFKRPGDDLHPIRSSSFTSTTIG